MKKTVKILSLFLVLVLLVVGCEKQEETNITEVEYLKELTFEELEVKLQNKEDIILEIVQTGCSNCTAFSPKFESVLNEYEIQAYSLNISYLSDAGADWLESYNVDGTPTVIFFEKGEETSTMKRIVGNQSREKVVSKLKANGYIEK